MSRHLIMLLMIASLACLGFSSSILKSDPQICDYLILLDDRDFSILNCTFTPKSADSLLEIFYKVTSDSSRANEIQYVLLDQKFTRQQSTQKLQPPVQHKGQIIKGEYLLKSKYIVQDWAFSVRVREGGSYKQVISLKNPKLLLRSIWKGISNLVTVSQ